MHSFPVAQQQRIHLQSRKHEFAPWVGKSPWRRKWQPTAIFLPGKSQTEEPGELQSMWSQRVRHNCATEHLIYNRHSITFVFNLLENKSDSTNYSRKASPFSLMFQSLKRKHNASNSVAASSVSKETENKSSKTK